MRDALELENSPSVPPDYPPAGGLFSLFRRLYVGRDSRQWKKVCPVCRVDLPQLIAAGMGSGERFAIVGGASTGKSQLIYAWIKQLQNLAPHLGLSARLVDTYDLREYQPTETSVLWRKHYASYIEPPHLNGGAPPPRQVVPKTTSKRLSSPLIARIALTRRPFWHKLTRPWADFRPIDLLFYDTAGESFSSDAAIRQFASYVLSATGLVFLVDPLACPELKALLAHTPTSVGSVDPPAELLSRIRKVYEDDHVVAHHHKLGIETAVVLTKEDLLRDRFQRDNRHAPGVHHSDYRGGFPAADIDAASADIKEYLRRSGQGGLLSLVETNFHAHRFFACSALGREPDSSGALDGPAEPFRVLEPICWLLHRRGYLPSAPLPAALSTEEERQA
jgi:hypothetical protein